VIVPVPPAHPVLPMIAPRLNTPNTMAARSCGILPRRLRSDTMPNIGSNSIASAIGPCRCDPVFAACELLV
jgi:hypothetical protein